MKIKLDENLPATRPVKTVWHVLFAIASLVVAWIGLSLDDPDFRTSSEFFGYFLWHLGIAVALIGFALQCMRHISHRHLRIWAATLFLHLFIAALFPSY